MERIPVPFEYAGKTFTEAEFTRPRAGAIAETRRQAEEGSIYLALVVFIAAGVSEFTDSTGETISDRVEIRKAVRQMPFVVASWAAIQILLGLSMDDTIEGVYHCPRCKAELLSDPDNPDRIGDLELVSIEMGRKIIAELEYPVDITGADGTALDTITTLTLHYPSLEDCIKADRKLGSKDDGRLQFGIFVEAIEAVNGEEINAKWRGEWGMFIFDRLDMTDLKAMLDAANEGGYKETIPRMCRKCGREWEADVDTSGFFVSGLRAG